MAGDNSVNFKWFKKPMATEFAILNRSSRHQENHLGADRGDQAEEHQEGVAWGAESPSDGAVGRDDDGVRISGGLQERRD